MTEPTVVPQAVELSFSNSKGGAWDDRELVNTFDAALLEFHIHHPGPGSWLDKATAALAKGQPLPGANAFGSSWYTATLPQASSSTPASSSQQPPSADLESESRQPKRARTSGPRNPYSSARPSIATDLSGQHSPLYSPPSPSTGFREPVDEQGPVAVDEEAEDEYDDDDNVMTRPADGSNGPAWNGNQNWGGQADRSAYDFWPGDEGVIFPPPSGQWPSTGSVDRDEAIGYALHAQYWAGYWMGVARGSGSTNLISKPSQAHASGGAPIGNRNSSPHDNGSRSKGQYSSTMELKR